MNLSPRTFRALTFGALALLAVTVCGGNSPTTAPAKPDVAPLLAKLALQDPKQTRPALEALGQSGDPRLVKFLKDYFMKSSAYVHQGKVVLKGRVTGAGVQLLDPLTEQLLLDDKGQPLVVPAADVKDLDVSRRELGFANAAVIALQLAEQLANPNKDARLATVISAGDRGEQYALPPLRAMLAVEKDNRVKRAAEEAIARIDLERGARDMINRFQDARMQKNALIHTRDEFGTTPLRKAEIEAELKTIDPALKAALDEKANPDEAEKKATRLAAAARLGELGSLRAAGRVKDAQAAEVDPAVAATYLPAIAKIAKWQTTVDWSGYLFSGLSAGSLLILVALGLSIIFGVMGVINMAQGELVMIGAYSTYVVQLAFQRWAPEGLYDWYFVLSIPVSFLVASGVGMLIEGTVVRRLYGRPLDTLLATYGIGLVVTQGVRVCFGDNIGVKAPSFLQGGWEAIPDIVFPYNRMFAIAFCAACVLLMYFVIGRTKLGLLLRATTQNRQMAGALGVPTRRVDLYTFGLGAGLAGLAGCALTPIEGVTPNMGSNYIIDSFLVVVTGGVGKLAGAIWAGLGIGMVNKLLEPIFQAVWAKVIILGLVVCFLQWRPSGLFPAKGRLADV
jgi:urea transport system permease protein